MSDGPISTQPLVVEMGSRESFLSREFSRLGFRVFTVCAGRDAPTTMPAIHVDFDNANELAVLNNILQDPHLALIFISLPHFSRSQTSSQSAAVHALLARTIPWLHRALQHGTKVILEAPSNYATRSHPLLKDLLPRLPVLVRLQPCKWELGSVQRRWIRLQSNIPSLQTLDGGCPHHAHQGRALSYHLLPKHTYSFATEVAKNVAALPEYEHYITASPNLFMDAKLYPQLLRRKHQPRGLRLPPLLPDFKSFHIVSDDILPHNCRWVPSPMIKGGDGR